MNRVKYWGFLPFLLAILFFSCNESSNQVQTTAALSYPETKMVDSSDNYFGTDVKDPYRWLENPDDPEVGKWIEEQNKITFGMLDEIPFREGMRKRLESIWNYPKYSAPFKKAGRYYFYKNDGLQNQSVLYSMKNIEDEPAVMLDPNSFSEDGTTSLSMFSVSKDGKYAAYGTSEGGSDWNEFMVMEIESGKKMEDKLEWIKFSGAAWKGDGFYYGRFPEPQEGQELSNQNENKKIYYHKLGDPQSADKLVFEDPEHPLRGIYASTTDDERFLLLYFSEGATNDNALSVKDLSKNGSEIVPIITEFNNNYDVVDNIGSKLLVITNDGAPRKRLIMIDTENPDPSNWEEIIPEREEVLDGVYLAGGTIIAEYMKDASSRLYKFDLEGNQIGEIELPTLGMVAGFNSEKDEDEAFYTFTSFTYPTTTYSYSVTKNESKVFRKSEIDFNSDEYETKQVFFESKDGEKVPMFIVHKKGIELNGKNPTLLYGYGGFNISLLPRFQISNIPLLENGGVYALVNLRGGGEYGEEWHKAGMLLDKQNVFNDFISAAEYLIDQKYTSSDYLGIMGGSNGGLLVGAVMCQRPELFKVALPAVGVMDMLRFHKFTIGHAWVVEYGSSEANKEQFDNLYGYSPLHNLKDGVEYPATMVMTADHDDRVVPAHSFKFISELQRRHKGNNPVVIRIDTKAGHGAGKSTTMLIDEITDRWAFMFYNMGITPEKVGAVD